MAEIWDYIAQYNPTGFYEDNRSKTLKNDYMNTQISAAQMKNAREKKIMDLQDAWANGNEEALRQLGIYAPEQRGKMIDNEEKMLEYARPLAQSFLQVAPENREKAWGQIYGHLKGVMDVSDMSPTYDESVLQAMQTIANSDKQKLRDERINEMAKERDTIQYNRDLAKLNYQNALANQKAEAERKRKLAFLDSIKDRMTPEEYQVQAAAINGLNYTPQDPMTRLANIALDPNAPEEDRIAANALIRDYSQSKSTAKNSADIMPKEVRDAQTDYTLTGNPESKAIVDRWMATQQKGGFGNTQAGLALMIKNNPENFPQESVDWANNYLASNDLTRMFKAEQNKAAGKKVGEREGEKMNKSDMGYYREGNQEYVIPNSEAADDYLAKNDKKITNNMEVERISKTVIEDIDRAMDLINSAEYDLAGWGGATLSYIPDTAAYNLKVLIDSIKGNSGVDSLLTIKRSGAGLGQIPQQQMDFLSNLKGNLSQSQSMPQLKRTMQRYKDIYTSVYNNAVSDNEKIFGKIKMPSQENTSGNVNYTEIPSDAEAWGTNEDDWGI